MRTLKDAYALAVTGQTLNAYTEGCGLSDCRDPSPLT